MTQNSAVQKWVDEVAALTRPQSVVWCDGSEAERLRLTREAVRAGIFIELNQDKMPGCYLHRSDPNDVARTEHLTFLCTRRKEDAGVTGNWMDPKDAYAKLGAIFSGVMSGRTMYVVPYLMGPVGSPFSKVGVQVTDSIYVVLSMRIMTRMGNVALESLGGREDFVRGLHSTADLNPERRFICHFPEDNTIWSVGSGYGGNALLGKKCFALRIASWLGRREGWMAEHMLIVGVENPEGEVHYIAGAFPSACGKTNLAMLVPPERYKGWKIHTVGDDIAWLRFGADGRLWAVNPENGFFGVAPGTSPKTNPNAMATCSRNSLFTNVVLTPERTVWWEGMDVPSNGAGYLDWQGKPWVPGSGGKGAHANSRFTAPAGQCPSLSPHWQDPQGVPISAILFGSRRSRLAPLVYQALSWQHGVYLGATLASETTAAATGAVGVVRRDPMAMLPFMGYNIGDYFAHWLAMGRRGGDRMPKVFRVNWFRVDSRGKFIWPGYGENMRVLRWIVDRCKGTARGVETPIGYLPAREDLDLDGVNVPPEGIQTLLDVDPAGWREATAQQKEFFDSIGPSLPKELEQERLSLVGRLGS